MAQSRLQKIRATGVCAVVVGIAACTSTVGPYIRGIEVTPDGAVIVERCSTVTTDYGIVATYDNESTWCDKNVLPLQAGAMGPAGPAGPASTAPPFAASPPPPRPPPLVAPPASVTTPAGAAPPSSGSSPVAGAGTGAGAGAAAAGGYRPPPSTGCSQGMTMIPAGTFAMGDRKDRVKVGQFCMDVTEVTADAYATCVRNGRCPADGLSCGPSATFQAPGKGEHPINCVDWSQAANYCQVQGKRLPTEEEWEWAARGGALGKTFPWGNVEPTSQVCWSGNGQLTGTCPVGSYPPGANPQGVLDLSGNVWEWTSGRRDSVSSERVARGGAWSSTASSYLRASERYWTSPLYRFIYIGFRCVL